MRHDSELIKKIVEDYSSLHPTVENSQEIVKKLSEKYRLAVPKLRAILVQQRVYVAQAKPKIVVEKKDAKVLLRRLRQFESIDDGSYSYEMARYSLVEELRLLLGYTGPAIEKFAKAEGIWPLSKSERTAEKKFSQFKTKLTRRNRSLSLLTWGLPLALILSVASCITYFQMHPEPEERSGRQEYCTRQGRTCDKDGWPVGTPEEMKRAYD